ncbi:hypothetical protein L6R50_13270 [Myxococcota bacterium]|nr:hypothetical protein [Myxococcota bacterium]
MDATILGGWRGIGPLALWVLAAGCGGSPSLPEGDDDTADDDAGPPPECTADSGCAPGEICESETCRAGDRNNALAEAVTVAYGDEVADYVNAPGDVDYYRIEGNAGDYVVVDTATDDPSDEAGADTVLRLWNSAGVEIGHNDDYERVSGQGTDAYLITRLAAAETYFFSVEDGRDFRGEEPEGGIDDAWRYEATLFQLDPALEEVEPNDAASQATPWEVTAYSTNYTHVGAVSFPGDVDWWRVDAAPGAMLRVYMFPDVGTRLTPLVTLWAPGDGEPDPIAWYDALDWVNRAYVPVLDPEGYVFLTVEDPGGLGGADRFYVLQLAEDDPAGNNEPEQEPNDDLGTAHEVALVTDGEREEAYLMGRIDPVGDVDVYALRVQDGAELSVVLGGRNDYGSRLSPYVRLLNEVGDVLEEAAVNAAEDPALDRYAFPSGGLYFLEVSSAVGEEGGAAWFYLMGIFVYSGLGASEPSALESAARRGP